MPSSLIYRGRGFTPLKIRAALSSLTYTLSTESCSSWFYNIKSYYNKIKNKVLYMNYVYLNVFFIKDDENLGTY